MIFFGVSERTVLGRALRCPLRLIPSNAQLRILRGPLRGKRWIAGSSIHRIWLGFYESKKQKAFSEAINPGNVVYDLGANVGLYSLLASFLVGSEGRVFSFEPAPRNLNFLRRHLQINEVKNCSVLDVAVSDVDGFANFDVGPVPMMGHLTSESPNALIVRTITVDGLVASGEIIAPNVIKCDIEGGEYGALTGALTTLAKYRPTIFLATHGSDVHERCCRLLADLHYRLNSLNELPLDQTTEIVANPL